MPGCDSNKNSDSNIFSDNKPGLANNSRPANDKTVGASGCCHSFPAASVRGYQNLEERYMVYRNRNASLVNSLICQH